MWFLIKGAFWFTLVLVALSYLGGAPRDGSASAPQFELANAVSAASGAYDYVSGLCGEKPDVCVKGGQTLQAIGIRAREGALVAYQLLNRQFGTGEDHQAISVDTAPAHGSVTEATIATPAAATSEDHMVTGTVSAAGNGVPLTITVPRPRPKPAG
ncbi:DUF5330 domain-containing protein [Agrobacterium vitis]|uniref:DUF5330 domain-containing protein n=1 Tax=Agrobacterium vitis TaxID=373 RepID=A0A368NYK9_AGRVI|nr:DUF5330 domain-containing protein [Agrobacterium vitis]KAA3519665.1 hypothetical protein DXM22_01875 [Agrobacterium vitis]KAA3532123.1 hypothetical protein DXT89_01850 [Agrobacterium vitis]MCF1475814.1 hypothetical protein [Agrobacterium vitis]MUZ97128.1 hypothetical protein [Agrobacterium vitis]MVA31982.1 hypothetical protein [Agrobacterium vitis]